MPCLRLYMLFQDELVGLLTPLEVASARRIFDFMDKDKGGVLEEAEVRGFYRNWYKNLDMFLNANDYL